MPLRSVRIKDVEFLADLEAYRLHLEGGLVCVPVAVSGHSVSELNVVLAKARTSASSRSGENDIPLLAISLERESIVRIAEVFFDDNAR